MITKPYTFAPNDLLSYEANFEPLDIETELQAWEDLQAEQNALPNA